METEVTRSSQILAKKAWNILRILLMMVKKGISKNKFLMDFNLVFKKCNQLATKAFDGLLVYHHSLICRPNKDPSHYFISPKDYEFSCSNSPAVGPIHHYLMMAHYNKFNSRSTSKSKSKSKSNCRYHLEDPTTVAAVQQVLEMINTTEVGPNSPLGVGMGMAMRGQCTLPGFGNGKSPLVRQLRVTDSPFPLKNGKGTPEEEEEDVKVNKAADEFIKKFYKNLRMQKSLESPCHIWTMMHENF